jgi:hypothetical protein
MPKIGSAVALAWSAGEDGDAVTGVGEGVDSDAGADAAELPLRALPKGRNC